MADGLNSRPSLVRATDEHVSEPPYARVGHSSSDTRARPASPHSQKFLVATAALAGIAVAAIVVAIVVLATATGDAGAAKWSSWSPTDGGTLGAREIADHLAPLYRISGVDQLDVVTVVNLANASAAGAAATPGSTSTGSGLQIAVRANPSSSQVSLLSGNTIAYNLCGIGSSNCAITTGTPSADRLLLLRREALELALYTFRYINGVDNVVTILPPGHTQQQSTLSPTPPTPKQNRASTTQPVDVALLFVKAELQPWLAQPLDQTLAEFPPTVAQLPLWKQTEEAGLVDQITARGLFTERLSQAQDGSSLIVLDPQPPQ
ncbi:MAG: hypothetical protein ACYC91_00150 [Solirubrobacteraceae bacterium]